MIDPALQPIVVRTAADNLWLHRYEDIDGDPIMNKAKMPPWRTHAFHYHVPAYIAQFYKTAYPDADIREYVNAVNDGTWRGWLTGEAKVASYFVTPVDTAFGVRYKCKIEIVCLKGGWQEKIQNMGDVYLSGGQYEAFYSPSFGKLDSTGDKLAATSDVELLDVKTYREVSFTPLGF